MSLLVEDQPEVVRLLVVRRHREDHEVGVVAEHRVLREGGAERVAEPLGVALRIGRHHGDVVDLARRDTARDVALRPIRERRLHSLRRHVPLVLPEDLVEMAARRVEAEGAPVAHRVLLPAGAGAALLEARDGGLEIAGAPRAPADVTEAGLRRLRQHQAVMRPLTPAAQEHGLPGASRLLEADDVLVEAQRFLRLRRQDLDVRKVCDQSVRHLLALPPGEPKYRVRPRRAVAGRYLDSVSDVKSEILKA